MDMQPTAKIIPILLLLLLNLYGLVRMQIRSVATINTTGDTINKWTPK